MEELHEYLVGAFGQCVSNGMKLPFVACTVSANGSVLVMRINDGRGPDILPQHFEDDVFAMPINMLLAITRRNERLLVSTLGV